MAIAKVEAFHKELQEWHKTLQFFEEETCAFEKQLEDVVLAETKHFQIQFMLKKRAISVAEA